MKFRSHFDYDVEAASNEACVAPGEFGESLTVQSQSEDTDINVLMRRFGVGVPLPQTARIPMQGDFSEVHDYRSALHAIMAAQDAFMELPAEARAKFDNDPQRLLEFASVPENIPELVKMGLGKEVSLGVSERGVGGAGKAPGGDAAASGGSAGGDGSVASGGAA